MPGDITLRVDLSPANQKIYDAWQAFSGLFTSDSFGEGSSSSNDAALGHAVLFGGLTHPASSQTVNRFIPRYVDGKYLKALEALIPIAPQAAEWLDASLLTYIGINPVFRTHFTEQFIGVSLLLNGLANLDTDLMRQAESRTQFKSGVPFIKNYIEDAIMDIGQVFTGHQAMPSTMIESVINSLYGGESKVNFYRVHVNMTTINEMDHTGKLGTIYLQVVLEWLQSKGFRVVQNPENTSFLFLGTDAQVRAHMNSFASEIKSIMRQRPGVDEGLFEYVEPKAVISRKKLSLSNLFSYVVRDFTDLANYKEVFEFGLSSHDLKEPALMMKVNGMVFLDRLLTSKGKSVEQLQDLQDFDSYFTKVKELYGDEFDRDELFQTYTSGCLSYLSDFFSKRDIPLATIREQGGYLLNKKIEAVIIKAVLGFLRELSAQTTYFEKEESSKAARVLYTEEELPTHGDDFDKWQQYLSQGSGFVGLARYHAGNYFDELEQDETLFRDPQLFGLKVGEELPGFVKELIELVPRRSRYVGYLRHQRPGSPGGAMEQLWESLTHLLFSDTDESLVNALSEVKEKSMRLRSYYEKVFRMIHSDERNASLSPRTTNFELTRGRQVQAVEADFFVEDVARKKHSTLFVLEIDSFKAYNTAHPTDRFDDHDYNSILALIQLTAKQLGLSEPAIRRVAGDQITISLNNVRADGDVVAGDLFSRTLQANVRNRFSAKPFQDLQKVAVASVPVQIQTDQTSILFDPSKWLRFVKENNLTMVPFFENTVTKDGETTAQLFIPYEGDNFFGDITNFLNRINQFFNLSHKLRLVGAPKIEKVRLKLWKKDGALIASKQALDGFEAFMRTLSVSLVHANHPVLANDAHGVLLANLEAKLGHELGILKESSLPHKEASGGFKIETISEKPVSERFSPIGDTDALRDANLISVPQWYDSFQPIGGALAINPAGAMPFALVPLR